MRFKFTLEKLLSGPTKESWKKREVIIRPRQRRRTLQWVERHRLLWGGVAKVDLRVPGTYP